MEKKSQAFKHGVNFYRLLIIFSFVCISLSGCDILQLNSEWCNRQIKIDGKYTDWPATQTYYNEEQNLTINLLNDKEYLYLCLITRNRKLEIELMESGMAAWFDPQGGKNKVFGVAFPIGLRRMGISLEEDKRNVENDWRDQEDLGGVIDREKERWRDKNFNQHLEEMEGLQDKLELLIGPFELKGREKNPQGRPKELSLEEAGKLGIEAKVGRENDYFVYELKVPLIKTSSQPFAIGFKAGNPIGLGLEIGGSMGMDMPGEEGAHMPPGGGSGKIPADMGHDGMFSKSDFQLWAQVTLSREEQGINAFSAGGAE